MASEVVFFEQMWRCMWQILLGLHQRAISLSFQKSDVVSAAKASSRHMAAMAFSLSNYWSRDGVCIPLANERSVELHRRALAENFVLPFKERSKWLGKKLRSTLPFLLLAIVEWVVRSDRAASATRQHTQVCRAERWEARSSPFYYWAVETCYWKSQFVVHINLIQCMSIHWDSGVRNKCVYEKLYSRQKRNDAEESLLGEFI